ncbi:MAG: gluconate 2-dehydrogenase subunit 3 family protein [Woeseiaceae bacterium]|nr:gluconate 2-dehydrogenase subunit 3 family protein [Woeseiaceae bacterium]
MTKPTVNRRQFLGGTGATVGTALARLGGPALIAAAQAACSARDEGVAFRTLSVDEAREIDAFSARILPTTTTPGAREAGVVHFFDHILGNELSDMLPTIRGMLQGFQAGIAERFPGAERFSDLDEADQDAWIAENEQTPFFAMGRLLTLFGFFAMSKYGGNRDHVGWALIGFEPHGVAAPPYGYYDARYMEEKRDGA